MKITIITVCFNAASTIKKTLDSVAGQTHIPIEHIVIDGNSKDGTLEILRSHKTHSYTLLSEPDNGIYDAMNKGLKMATGDVIGLLHSDDMYVSDSVIAQVAMEFSDSNLDAIYADAIFFRDGEPDSITRYFRSDRFSLDTLAWGWLPAHTTIFFRRRVFEQFGLYKTDYKIAADVDFIARVFRSKNFRAKYIPKVWVKMRIGGISTGGWRNTILLNREVLRALRENGIKTNMAQILSKYPLKLLEFLDSRDSKKHKATKKC